MTAKQLRIDVLTLFPKMFESPFAESIVSRARQAGRLQLEIHDIRSWTTDRHHVVDDAPYGGGAGMVLKPEPLSRAIRAVRGADGHVVLLSGDHGAIAKWRRSEAIKRTAERRADLLEHAKLTPAERVRLPRDSAKRDIRDADLVEAYRSGVGSYRIAARFGISPATVRARLRAAGVRLRAARSVVRGPSASEVARMRATGLTVRQLASHFGVSHVTILDRLKKAKR